MATPLLIAIGNPLRGDDGVAWRLALQAGRLRPAIAMRRVQQLTPELCEELGPASRILFLDAWPVAPGLRSASGSVAEPRPGGHTPWPAQTTPRLLPIAAGMQAPSGAASPAGPSSPPAAPDPAGFSHALDPRTLLALTGLLHGQAPPAWELRLPAWRFRHGSSLSPAARRQLPSALALLLGWCDGRAPERSLNRRPDA
jgi:Ni,Fe-hydrogenase maturation factor